MNYNTIISHFDNLLNSHGVAMYFSHSIRKENLLLLHKIHDSQICQTIHEKRTEHLCIGMMSSFCITHTLPARSPDARLRPLGLKATPQHVMS